jgi:hypothetical protein
MVKARKPPPSPFTLPDVSKIDVSESLPRLAATAERIPPQWEMGWFRHPFRPPGPQPHRHPKINDEFGPEQRNIRNSVNETG